MITPKVIAIVALMAGPIRATTSSIDGVWLGNGWGSLYAIHGPTLEAFEITKATCVLGFSAARVSQANTRDEIRFRTHKGEVYIVAGTNETHKTLKRPAGLTSIALSRAPSLPEICTPPTSDTPLGNFEVFARTFAEQYISFDLRRLDWDRTMAQQREKITPHTTPTQLFEALKAMIAPLHDIHTGIEAPKIKQTFDPALRPGTDRIVRGSMEHFAKAGRRELAGVTDRAYFHQSLISLCHGQWQYGLTEGGVGYLRILEFGDYSRKSGFENDLTALNHALDQILSSPQLQGLIIDVRLSFGGDDRLGLAIASRLTSREYMAYAIQALRSRPTEYLHTFTARARAAWQSAYL